MTSSTGLLASPGPVQRQAIWSVMRVKLARREEHLDPGEALTMRSERADGRLHWIQQSPAPAHSSSADPSSRTDGEVLRLSVELPGIDGLCEGEGQY